MGVAMKKSKRFFSALPLFRKSSKPNPHALYEQMKAALPPDLSPREYEAACQRIARELGI